MKQSLATLATTGIVINPALTSGAFAASSDLIKVGLVGCGGRGTGAAAQTLRADPNVELVAMADAFGDQIELSYQNLKKTDVQDRVKVDTENKFVGFDAFTKTDRFRRGPGTVGDTASFPSTTIKSVYRCWQACLL